jgi:hypothetical protein
MSSTQCFEAASIEMASSALSAAAHTLRGLNAKWPLAQGENGPSRCGMVGSIQLLLSGNAVSPPSGTSAQSRDRGLWFKRIQTHTRQSEMDSTVWPRSELPRVHMYASHAPSCTCGAWSLSQCVQARAASVHAHMHTYTRRPG